MAIEHNPPKGYVAPPVPTEDGEEAILRELFGEPDKDGVYAPYIEGDE